MSGTGVIGIGRRGLLGASAALGVSALAGIDAATAATLNLDDPLERVRTRVKISGSLEDSVVHRYIRMHIYGFDFSGTLVPYYTLQNYSQVKFKKLAEDRWESLVYECGIYTVFDTDETITEWVNPITGETREVWQFRAGPLRVEIGPDGGIAGPETTVKPRPMAITQIGPRLFVPQQSAFSYPNAFKPDEFPKESSGPISHWDSHFTASAAITDLTNPDLVSVPAELHMSNMVSWAPWMGMGQTSGRTFARGFGQKLMGGLDDLPKAVLANVERFTPEVLDIANWTEPYDDVAAYKAKLQAERR